MRVADQTGCANAIAKGGASGERHRIGVADIGTGERLKGRHRFRVASHSKTFTATGILKLKEQGRLHLDVPLARIRERTASLGRCRDPESTLTHGAGLSRDGDDAGNFTDQRPFLSKAELLAALEKAPPIEAGLRPKYSNVGFGLLGLVIESVTSKSYCLMDEARNHRPRRIE